MELLQAEGTTDGLALFLLVIFNRIPSMTIVTILICMRDVQPFEINWAPIISGLR